ncbi:unnamed protein product, partial [Scytosiphon promiscuus]
GGPYGWSPSSCKRHLRKRRRSRVSCVSKANKPKALVDGEMETALAGGSRVAETAMRAVRQANAQVCLANLETARKEISLGIARTRYKRLEDDMFRSRLELADAFSEFESHKLEHEREMEQAEERAKQLEVALRAADEVLRQLTAEIKRKRYETEDREASLRASLAASERRADTSERECTQQKLSTWGTIARETGRAAGRERRKRHTKPQLRYVLENEFLRAARTKAEESEAEVRERLGQTEVKLVKALAATPPAPRFGGPERMMTNARKAMGKGGSRAQRLATANAQGELRYTRGIVAELSFLLSATESDRDSLASLLVIAEQEMDRLLRAQEELALKLAWGNIAGSQGQQQWEHPEIEHGSGGILPSSGNGIPSSAKEEEGGASDATGPRASAASFERSRAALESLELRRRVRDLEVLLKAVEAGAREIENENQRLRCCQAASPHAEMAWGDGGGGVVCSTADSRQHPGSSCARGSGVTTPTISNTGSGDNARFMDDGDTGGEAGAAEYDHTHGEGGGHREVVSNDGDIGGIDTGATSGIKSEQGCSLSPPMLVPLSEGVRPVGWGWAGEDRPQARPQSRYRPRSSPFAGHRHRGYSSGDGEGDGSGCARGAGTIGDEEASLIKGKLAWVLGLPAETTTENELLAEVMHLVVDRGKSATDAGVLHAQLERMDEQSLSLSRLAVAAAPFPSQNGGGDCGDRHRQSSSVKNGACYGVLSEGRRKGGGSTNGGLDFIDIGVRCSSSNDTFLSSLCHTDGCGDAQHARPVDNSAAGRRRSATRAAPNQAVGRKVSSTAVAAAAGTATVTAGGAGPASRPVVSRPGGGGKSTRAEGAQPQPRIAVAANDRRPAGASEGPAAVGSRSVGAAANGLAAAGVAAVGGKTAVEVEPPVDENTIRTSFPKTLQGRVVSIDIFCTKVFSEADKKQEEEGGKAHEAGLKMDDIDYEIRVEAYDPVMLKQHVLHVQDSHVKGCLSAHPHLYTLGPYRTRLHQSLAERLILMPEDDVRTEQSQQERVGSGGGSGGDGAGGSAVSSGAGPPGHPNLLLVLIGDAGEIVTTEKLPEQDNPDAEGEGGGVSAPVKQPHRHAKSAIMQASARTPHRQIC